jgi:queuosine precursor transporter
MHTRALLTPMLAMGAIIAVSNVLVQYPLGTWLTYGALTYPFAFLVTDLVTRTHGETSARRVIGVGFVVGILSSLVASFFALTTLRIALASASAFLVAQLLDVKIFTRLRNYAWWQRPAISSTLASIVDTILFFSIAFSATTFFLLPDGNTWAQELVPFLGVGYLLPLWMSLAVADLAIKLVMVLVLLPPYRALSSRLVPRTSEGPESLQSF